MMLLPPPIGNVDNAHGEQGTRRSRCVRGQAAHRRNSESEPLLCLGFHFRFRPRERLVAPTLVPLLKFYFHEEVRKATVSAIMFSQVGSGEGTCLRAR
ncbi:hypothetical protein Taro_009929 [Colocasia esculenta]|uniref:Uncharacterized protein n=1 Tax=Colocasia esculenta TaxID=4460 RepID=A0A843U737_COLES|nr:hypothetical protein [Colocasia esculenta]